jgi:hypothetical protein
VGLLAQRCNEVDGGGRVVQTPRATEPKGRQNGGKMNI